MGGETAMRCLDEGADYVLIGRAAILHHDFPKRVIADPTFEAVPLPVTREYLNGEKVSDRFVDYIVGNWPEWQAA
jgi:hypothetical protein